MPQCSAHSCISARFSIWSHVFPSVSRNSSLRGIINPFVVDDSEALKSNNLLQLSSRTEYKSRFSNPKTQAKGEGGQSGKGRGN